MPAARPASIETARRYSRLDPGRRHVAPVSRLRERSVQKAGRFRAAVLWVWCKCTDHQNLRLTAAFAWLLMRRPTERRIHPARWVKLDASISSALSLPVERELEKHLGLSQNLLRQDTRF